MTSIQLKKLAKKYKDITVVNNLEFSVKQGEFFALLGENGAGKTTLISMLCGLLTPSSGDALVLGNSILTNIEKVKPQLNISPQETAIAPNLTVRENLEFIAGIYGISKNEAKIKTTEMIELFHLKEKEKAKAKTLSGGMQRRLSIAMGMITNPKIFFLDEPTLGLDVRSRRELWANLAKLKGKMTIILTTHYLEEAEALADRIVILQKGSLKGLGTVEELKQQTNTETFEDAFLAICDEEGQVYASFCNS
ncbi:ABC transporter ATP-binding protein [Bacillus aquiflavi]|uniref:ABC transporter ATP-binding protein n=1 Tax=Bacillus aquiflavi TaxID=2672567 RepID=A0A6B3W431_9BACI|nr:ABC transporter ATP-binding protein [Bacillus aquiflavi]MBA4537138.1 ABC transporter ATP-binding protein [Bacillus aquiflavi]NEY82723.1 ABC transporter ATP-binding protein [Bacillus aquiflavi]UAC49765.1 ABC transporter ATP-binding protein [Bacillus aquiflavi]